MLAKLKALLTSASDGLMAALSKVGDILKSVWNSSKGFIVAIGAVILAIEFNKIKEYFLVKAGAKEIAKDNVQNQVLQNQENTDEQKAAVLQQQAQALENQAPTITDDWNTKDGK